MKIKAVQMAQEFMKSEDFLNSNHKELVSIVITTLINEVNDREARLERGFKALEKAILAPKKSKDYLTRLALQELLDPDPWMDEPWNPAELKLFEEL